MDEYRVTSMRVVNISARHHYQAKRERAAILKMVRDELRLARDCNAAEAILALESLAHHIEARGDG